jgi:hypothetical protein
MIVLHASLVERQVRLWGEARPETARPETARPETARAAGRKRGRAAAVQAPAFPYDAGGDRLREALVTAGVAEPAGSLAIQTACLWAPAAGAKPIPSSPLVAEQAPGEACHIAPWSLATVPITSQQAVDLFCACVERDLLAPGVVIGSTLLYWTSAFRFAAALVAREQFLPGVRREAEGWRACWEPSLLGADAESAASLARGMPAACRGITTTAAAPPETASSAILTGFLSLIVDTLARSAAVRPAIAPSGRKRRREAPSLHDQWLDALRAPESETFLDGTDADLNAFARQISEWRRPLRWSQDAPFRLCFRLEEPSIDTEDGDHWYVRYLLRSVEDPSLLLPSELAWKGKGTRAALLQREGFQPVEFLLTALGEASRVCPEIEGSLRDAAPAGFSLETESAHAFLTERAWMLEQAGFGVLLPSWWTKRGGTLKLGARASIKSPKLQAKAGLSMESIVEVDWQVALGGEPLTQAELEELARHKASLVRWRGQWVQVDAKEIEQAIGFWKKRGSDRMTARDAMALALGAGTAPAGFEIDGVEATGWMQGLLERMQDRARLEEEPEPAGFRGELRPYQRRGYSWLRFLGRWGLGACLADDMGLGKTPQTLALVESQREAGAPVLVVCPTSVVGNWQKEAQRFAPDLPVLVHHGVVRKRGEEFVQAAGQSGLVICSYALLHRDFEALSRVPWSGVVLDEAQNIKNPETRQSQAARALRAGWRVALTGTPVENHVGDLWAIMEFLNPGLLGGQTEFRRRFFVPIQANSDLEATDRLQRLTGPFILRRLKTDRAIIADLPEKMEMKTFCTLTREQASLYEAIVKEATGEIDGAEGIQRKGVILATLSKLKQVCNHPAQLLKDNSPIPGRSGKLARLTEMLEEVLAAGEKALIFSQFAEMGEIIRRHLEALFGREALFLHGGVARKERERMVERFQGAGSQTPFFILSLKAGGVGLNLTAANHVFHFDRWWNPAVENQATDRAFRIGQTRNVQVHKFVCAGTLEEKIDAMIESKQAVAQRVVGTGEDWITNLSTAQLKELFALSHEAVAD